MDVTPAIATIVAAFADDPVERWLYPEEAGYLEHFPRFVEAFAGAGMVSAVGASVDASRVGMTSYITVTYSSVT